uniref:Mitochondrial assembly of ribosomal large subunit protein 1 n=1 Tax=Anolis carolinensis TaxID=28377 RepID=G1KP02_ANOCA
MLQLASFLPQAGSRQALMLQGFSMLIKVANCNIHTGLRQTRVLSPTLNVILRYINLTSYYILILISFPLLSDPGSSRFSFEDIVSFLRQENAKDICAIQLPPEMKYSNYFVIVSGSSPRHLHAMAHYLMKMYKHLKTDCEPHVVIEGKDTDDWLCIDFGHTVVHFMLPETREVYELEKLWTLRSYDDQLAQMIPESMPENFILGMNPEEEELASI